MYQLKCRYPEFMQCQKRVRREETLRKLLTGRLFVSITKQNKTTMKRRSWMKIFIKFESQRVLNTHTKVNQQLVLWFFMTTTKNLFINVCLCKKKKNCCSIQKWSEFHRLRCHHRLKRSKSQKRHPTNKRTNETRLV